MPASVFPSSPSSSSSTSHPALMSPDVGSTSPMYAASGDRGVDNTPAANRGSLVRSFTPSNASVTVVNPSGDALTTVASTLLNAKTVRLDGASLNPKQVHAFCDHVEFLIHARVLRGRSCGRRVERFSPSLRLSGSAILLRHLTTS
jgi:hypothetical protein